MYTIEQLNEKNRDEVRNIAKQMEIPGRSKMNKSELIDEIIKQQNASEADEAAAVEPVKEAHKPEPVVAELIKEDDEYEKSRKENHDKIVSECEVGNIVAFKILNTGKVKSAKVTRKSTKNRKLEVETAYGKKFIISFDDVVWVKTSPEAKWPRGVYKALKGIE